ncbi:MAG: DivIVA domain-containing protein [Firmicutes bacterium]|nr:DivIVA domain-containing protein [Bacillota bacterium]
MNFRKSKNGYCPIEVNEFFKTQKFNMAADINAIRAEVTSLKNENARLRKEIDSFEASRQYMANAILAAEEKANQMVLEGREAFNEVIAELLELYKHYATVVAEIEEEYGQVEDERLDTSKFKSEVQDLIMKIVGEAEGEEEIFEEEEVVAEVVEPEPEEVEEEIVAPVRPARAKLPVSYTSVFSEAKPKIVARENAGLICEACAEGDSENLCEACASTLNQVKDKLEATLQYEAETRRLEAVHRILVEKTKSEAKTEVAPKLDIEERLEKLMAGETLSVSNSTEGETFEVKPEPQPESKQEQPKQEQRRRHQSPYEALISKYLLNPKIDEVAAARERHIYGPKKNTPKEVMPPVKNESETITYTLGDKAEISKKTNAFNLRDALVSKDTLDQILQSFDFYNEK